MDTYDFGISTFKDVVENINNSPVQGFENLTPEFKAASYAVGALREANEDAAIDEAGVEAHLDHLAEGGAKFNYSEAVQIAVSESKMYMHEISGDVASKADWKADYDSMDIESWFGLAEEECNAEDWIKGGKLIKVEKDKNGEWVEA